MTTVCIYIVQISAEHGTGTGHRSVGNERTCSKHYHYGTVLVRSFVRSVGRSVVCPGVGRLQQQQ